MQNINISNTDIRSKRSRRNNRFNILPITIIPFFLVFLYFLVFLPTESRSAISYLLGSKNWLNYKTYSIYFDDSVEGELVELISGDLEDVKFEKRERFKFTSNMDKADITIKYAMGDNAIYSTYLLPVGHLYWIEGEVSLENIYSGEYSLVVKPSTYDKYSKFLDGLEIVQDSNVIDGLVEGESIGLVEPEDLDKEMKLLSVDGRYFLDTFDAGFPISLVADSNLENSVFVSRIIESNIDIDNRDINTDSVLKINMTGVTAIARNLARLTDQSGDYSYPAQLIGEFLADADLTHTSNEVSFVEGCNQYSGLRFCSKPEYIETLKSSGIDIVELTGNHNNDYGSSKNTDSIEMYKEQGWDYFGGGLNKEDASQALTKDIKGSKVGFLGYNPYDSMLNSYALAGTSNAGANYYSESILEEDIKRLKQEVDIVIVTFQFQECYSYPSSDVIFPVCYKPINNQKETFRKAVDFGADIVVGTQAHQPQTYEVYNDSLIFYGLGNLFFDQSRWIGTRQGMVLTHYIYNGELIQSKITTTIYDTSLQTKIATQEEGDLLLELLREARSAL